MLYELGGNILIVIILSVLRISHYLDWVSQKLAEVWHITFNFVIKRKRERMRERARERERERETSSNKLST